MKTKSNEERKNAYQILYTKISKVTAEVDGKKQVFYGQLRELFADANVSHATITRFMWAITHKTEVLPVVLFSVRKNGHSGVVVERLHSGFYTEKREHIIGFDLIPYIMKAATLHQPKPNKGRNKDVVASKKLPTISKEEYAFGLKLEVATSLTGLSGVSEDALAQFGRDAQERRDKALADLALYEEEVQRREKKRQEQQKLQDILELMDMDKEQLKELLK